MCTWQSGVIRLQVGLVYGNDPYRNTTFAPIPGRKPYQPAGSRPGRYGIVKDIGFGASLGRRPWAQGILVSSYKVRRDENAPILGDNGCPFGAGGIAVTSPAHGPVGCPWWSDAGRRDCGPPRNSRTWAAHALRRHSHRRHAGDRHIQMNGWPS